MNRKNLTRAARADGVYAIEFELKPDHIDIKGINLIH